MEGAEVDEGHLIEETVVGVDPVPVFRAQIRVPGVDVEGIGVVGVGLQLRERGLAA